MNRNIFFSVLLLTLFCSTAVAEPYIYNTLSVDGDQPDTLKQDQILFNGKVWRNQYYMIKGDEFLFSRQYSPGSVRMDGNDFRNILINYDIYNDEILTPKKDKSVIQLNKEMVDSFAMVSEGKTYRFVKAEVDSLSDVKGYVMILYKGKSALYVKYKKEIQSLAVDDKYDLFSPVTKVYLLKKGEVFQISGKGDLLKAFPDDKALLKSFMKKNGLKVSKAEPESFIPVLRYYDNLSR
jgi:hypothetical protein